MTDSKKPNMHSAFDNNVMDELGLYVYALFDPRDNNNRPFYVGKGGGQHGNDRVLHHFEEARLARLNTESSRDTIELDKVKTIWDIWDSDKEVIWKIIRRKLPSESEALAVEAALIDAFTACGFKLTNKQGGTKGNLQGLLDSDSLYQKAAPPIEPWEFPAELRNRPLFIFNIGKQVESLWKEIDRIKHPEDRPDYVQATCCCWNVGAHWRALPDSIAIGVVSGISRAVFKIKSWERSEIGSKLWRIDDERLYKEITEKVLNRKFNAFLEPAKGYLQYGGFVVCEVTQGGARIFRRGSKTRFPDGAPET